MNLRIVAPILGLAALAVGYQNWRFFQEGQLAPAVFLGDATEGQDEDVEEWEELGLDPILPEIIDGYLAELGPTDRNPFAMRSSLQTRDDLRSLDRQLVLDGTLVGETRSVAWIDGVSVREGSAVGDYRIVEIGPAWIDLEGPGALPFRLGVGEAANAAGTFAERTSRGVVPSNDVVEGFDE
ncbi:MAG: hypothetical protein HKP27_16690 [Myxococcales bacterium]|nr:hypothetical protein [Myxococcales bacterium]